MTEQSENMNIALEIRRQLGGQHFTKMTGAKQFVAVERGLQIHLPRNTFYEVTLNGRDLYDVKYCRNASFRVVKGVTHISDPKVISARTDISVEQLQSTFTSMTGLHTSLFGKTVSA